MFTTFKAGPGKVPLFVEGSAFHDPWHYGKLMGYDKYVSASFMTPAATFLFRPIDLMWDSELNCTKSEAEARRRKMGEEQKQ